MKKLLSACLVALAAEIVFADAPKKISKANYRDLINRREGGFLVDMRNQKGRLLIINAQSEMGEENIRASTKAFGNDMKIKIDFEKGVFDLKTAKGHAEATVFVISDESLPSMMIAADDHWGFVNVAKMRTEKEEFFKARVRKEIVRVAGFLLGAGDSYMYPECLTGHINDISALDGIPNEQLPVDVLQRVLKSMENIGIKPYRNTTYRRACEQGWAPSPTNEYQKAVWEKVHTLPTKPIKIEFNPETDK